MMNGGPEMMGYVACRGCGGGDRDFGYGEAVGHRGSYSSIGLDLVGREASIGGLRSRGHSVVLSLASRTLLRG